MVIVMLTLLWCCQLLGNGQWASEKAAGL